MDTRELFARLLECEAGGEGEEGMKAVATVVVNRATVPYGEFARISNGGNIRNIIEQMGQFTCLKTSVGGQYNPQNVYDLYATEESFKVADWALEGNVLSEVGNSLFFFNPYSSECPQYFPAGGIGKFITRVGNHCFYIPTQKYRQT